MQEDYMILCLESIITLTIGNYFSIILLQNSTQYKSIYFFKREEEQLKISPLVWKNG